MRSRLIVLLVGFMLPGVALSQDGVIKDFSTDHVEKFIKDVMKVDAKKTVQGGITLFQTPDLYYDVALHGGPKKCLVFRYVYDKNNATPKTMNDWNLHAENLTRAARVEGKTVLQATINLQAGVSMDQLRKVYDAIQEEKKTFEKATEGGPQGGA